MKRILLILLTLVLLATAPIAMAEYVKVDPGSRLRVRSGPSSDYMVIGRLPRGTYVQILEDVGRGWVRIDFESRSDAYVHSSYLIADHLDDYISNGSHSGNSSSGNSQHETPLNRIGYINNGSFVNVRSGPGYNHSSIGKVYSGEPINIIASIRKNGNGWYKVKYNDGIGYMRAPLVSFDNKTTSTTPLATSTNITWKESAMTKVGYANGTNGYLNVRSGPGYDFSIIGTFNNDIEQTFNIIAVVRRNGNGWYKITYGDGFAYVRAPLVKFL